MPLMKKKSPVFERNYRYYLEMIGALDLPSRAKLLGAEADADGLIVSFFGRPHRISGDGVIGPDGLRPCYSTCIILFKYLLMCPDTVKARGPWTSFRDFKDAGPLLVYFAKAVEALITEGFEGDVNGLASAAKKMGGRMPDTLFSHDLSIQFDPLPRLSMLLLFNDRDEEFSSHCSVLFERQTEAYLDMESVAVLGHVLSEGLLMLK
jgi:hypothetical protein